MGDSLPRTPLNHRAKFDATDWLATHRIGMCGYTSVPEVGRTCVRILLTSFVSVIVAVFVGVNASVGRFAS